MLFADFVEHTMGIQFLEYQKKYLNKLYERTKEGEKILFLQARGSNRFDYSLFYAVMFALYEQQFERSKNEN